MLGRLDNASVEGLATRKPLHRDLAGNGMRFRLNLEALKWTENVRRKKRRKMKSNRDTQTNRKWRNVHAISNITLF